MVSSLRDNNSKLLSSLSAVSSYCALQPRVRNGNPQDTSDIICKMGVAYNIRRGFGVGLPVPETSFEKLGPMGH